MSLRKMTRSRRPAGPGRRKPEPVRSTVSKTSPREPAEPSQKFPVHIRSTPITLGTAERDYIRRKLGSKLGKYASSVERVSVRIDDVNGPRGGIDQRCRIKIVLHGLPSVVFESRDSAMNAAVDAALSGVQRAVRRTTQRRRMKPLRRGQ